MFESNNFADMSIYGCICVKFFYTDSMLKLTLNNLFLIIVKNIKNIYKRTKRVNYFFKVNLPRLRSKLLLSRCTPMPIGLDHCSMQRTNMLNC